MVRKNSLSFRPTIYPDDLIHVDRWMCSNCGLVFDFDSNFEIGLPGWTDSDPSLDQPFSEFEQIDYKEICPRCNVSIEESPLIRIKITPATNIEDWIPIIQQGEGLRIDYKVDFSKGSEGADKLGKYIAAFATSSGGRIFLGVENNGNAKGYDGIDSIEGKEKLQERIRGITGNIKPAVTCIFDFASEKVTHIAIITVQKGYYPVYFFKNKPYIREMDEARPATPEEVHQLSIEWEEKRRKGK